MLQALRSVTRCSSVGVFLTDCEDAPIHVCDNHTRFGGAYTSNGHGADCRKHAVALWITKRLPPEGGGCVAG